MEGLSGARLVDAMYVYPPVSVNDAGGVCASPTVTSTAPRAEPVLAGTRHVSVVGLRTDTCVARFAPNNTVVVDPKLVPEIVTKLAPEGGPWLGVAEIIAGPTYRYPLDKVLTLLGPSPLIADTSTYPWVCGGGMNVTC